MLRKMKILSVLMIVTMVAMLIPIAVCADIPGDDEGNLYSYRLAKVIQVPGRQGITTDGTYYYVSDSRALYKCDKNGNVALENKKPFKTFPKDAVCNHIGDIDYYNGELYIGAEEFKDGRGFNIQIAIFDAETLEYKRSIPFDEASGQIEVCAITVDPLRKVAWMADWCNGRYLYQYDLTTGTYIGKMHLQPVPQYQQGIYYYNYNLLITADDGDANYWEPDHMYRVNADPAATCGLVQLEKVFSEFTRTGEIEGLCVDPTTEQLLVLFNRGTKVVEGMPVGFYTGYTKEVHEVYIYDIVKP
ncbi:hypothetical protein HRM2_32380 [Desulforapulum autotrophicum HRM2]|uniref:Cell surface protein n=1 Tax=Desulforapulum autotrophicum (strain ATCC 43914 / DSM 3382 / VKM B-1955 / HRM2) TaxID=177437 RepID=C0QLL3_DESAH|nr:hypothetical protein [Desulforapulum autotrophicum]ACN16317.1 hypothetical protein HRM2_32380 [Desulforapulum autotrophicum HRM2]